MKDLMQHVIAEAIESSKKGPVKWCKKCSRYHEGANGRCIQAKVVER